MARGELLVMVKVRLSLSIMIKPNTKIIPLGCLWWKGEMLDDTVGCF